MPIVISRETGAVKDAYTYTQEQLDKAWEWTTRWQFFEWRKTVATR